MIEAWMAMALAFGSGASSEAATRAVAAQAEAWNRGDLESALAAYCDDPGMTWISSSGVSRGFEGFAASMREQFRDPASMGRYVADVIEARDVGRRSALVTVRWSISRGAERLMGGVSTQLWQRCDGRLRITLEHAS